MKINPQDVALEFGALLGLGVMILLFVMLKARHEGTHMAERVAFR
jgi:hypothetical protein